MSYSYNGACYADVDALSQAVLRTFPLLNSDGLTTASSISANSGGLVSLVVVGSSGQSKNISFDASSDCVPFSSSGLIGSIIFCYFVGWGSKRILGMLGFLTDAGRLD